MNVALASMFRDSTGYLARYFAQVDSLRGLLETRGDTLRVLAVENDSADDTHEVIDRWAYGHFVDVVLVQAHDDCPYYPSIDHQPRWQHIAWVCNQALDLVNEHDDVVLYVESDLVWTPDEMVTLIDQVTPARAMTACVYHREYEGRWYDTWGATLDGVGFRGLEAPYHPAMTDEPLRVDTCASVLACPGQLARTTRFSSQDAFRGWTRDIAAKGGEVWLDPHVGVVHP